MQDHRDGADRSASGNQPQFDSEYHETASFQDGYFRSGDENQLDYRLSFGRNGRDESRINDNDALQPSQDHISSSYNLWAPLNGHHGETSPTHAFNSSSLGMTSSDYWTPSLRGKNPNFLPLTMRHNKGPLDVRTSPISSPVSSSEDSVKPGFNDSTVLESQWKQANQTGQYTFSAVPNNSRFASNESTRLEDEEASHNRQMQASLELANRLASSSSDVQRSYVMAPNAKVDPSSPWYAGQRGPYDAESAYDAHLRSAAASNVPPMDLSQSRVFQLEQRVFDHAPSSIDNTAEFSIFVGDLSPDLREEDLVAQFLHPSAWPASHPFAIAHAHAQQAKGNYASPAKIRPAPFLSTKSAKIMKDPLTGASRGFGFVRFSKEEDCARALVEMQGMVINPLTGSGRPLRVCTATPKNRTVTQSQPVSPWSGPSLTEALTLYQQLRVNQDRMALPGASVAHEVAATSVAYGKPNTPALFSPTAADFYSHSSVNDTKPNSGSSMSYSNSALDPNNTTVFVGGLSSLISEDTLKTFFAPFGEIIYVKIPPGKGCGFVQFVKKVDAERAIERMQGFPIGGGRIRLSWGRSQGDKAAAAAAQAVAQTGQYSHLASLASLSGMTSAQLSHLTSGISSTINESDAQFFQRLAALAAASKVSSRERESLDLQRAASLQHLPAMEHQHRQAQRQAVGSLGYPVETAGHQTGVHAQFSGQWTEREQYNVLHSDGVRDEYLASLTPSLRLDEVEQSQISPSHYYSRPGVASPTATDGRDYMQSLSPSYSKEVPPFKGSRIFSPFSPPVSPAEFEEANPSRFTSSSEQRQQKADIAKDSPFLRYLEQHNGATQQPSTSSRGVLTTVSQSEASSK